MFSVVAGSILASFLLVCVLKNYLLFNHKIHHNATIFLLFQQKNILIERDFIIQNG